MAHGPLPSRRGLKDLTEERIPSLRHRLPHTAIPFCGPTVAVFYNGAVYYEAPRGVKGFRLRLCCSRSHTSFPQFARWKPIFPIALHPQNRLASAIPQDTEGQGIFEVISGINWLPERLIVCANLDNVVSLLSCRCHPGPQCPNSG